MQMQCMSEKKNKNQKTVGSGLRKLYKINSWQVLMLLLVEEPSLNHSNAFFGERKKETRLAKPPWRSVQHDVLNFCH